MNGVDRYGCLPTGWYLEECLSEYDWAYKHVLGFMGTLQQGLD